MQAACLLLALTGCGGSEPAEGDEAMIDWDLSSSHTVGDVDWQRRLVWVEPTEEPGRSRWSGGRVCAAIPSSTAGSP